LGLAYISEKKRDERIRFGADWSLGPSNTKRECIGLVTEQSRSARHKTFHPRVTHGGGMDGRGLT